MSSKQDPAAETSLRLTQIGGCAHACHARCSIHFRQFQYERARSLGASRALVSARLLPIAMHFTRLSFEPLHARTVYICARWLVLGHRICPNAKTSLSLPPARQLLPGPVPRNARDARMTSAPTDAIAKGSPNERCPYELDETHHRRSLRPLLRSLPLARLGNAWVLASRLGQHRSTSVRPCFQRVLIPATYAARENQELAAQARRAAAAHPITGAHASSPPAFAPSRPNTQ